MRPLGLVPGLLLGEEQLGNQGRFPQSITCLVRDVFPRKELFLWGIFVENGGWSHRKGGVGGQ
ncbi:hypothetical protein C5Y93_14410 [Blastopirellula marina]|uniref:Uncharacterized protein n=1 Tax=Blastopirellula marina TaxID=124 RepID=A0A2S8GMG2_9BACT|nr:hypothetical protein C5Y93_14410 [Blastopirellula marina]